MTLALVSASWIEQNQNKTAIGSNISNCCTTKKTTKQEGSGMGERLPEVYLRSKTETENRAEHKHPVLNNCKKHGWTFPSPNDIQVVT